MLTGHSPEVSAGTEARTRTAEAKAEQVSTSHTALPHLSQPELNKDASHDLASKS